MDRSSLSQGDEDANVSVEDSEKAEEGGERQDVGGVKYSSSSRASSTAESSTSQRTSSDCNKTSAMSAEPRLREQAIEHVMCKCNKKLFLIRLFTGQ